MSTSLRHTVSHVVDVVVDKKSARASDAGSVRLRKLLRSRGHVRLDKRANAGYTRIQNARSGICCWRVTDTLLGFNTMVRCSAMVPRETSEAKWGRYHVHLPPNMPPE